MEERQRGLDVFDMINCLKSKCSVRNAANKSVMMRGSAPIAGIQLNKESQHTHLRHKQPLPQLLPDLRKRRHHRPSRAM